MSRKPTRRDALQIGAAGILGGLASAAHARADATAAKPSLGATLKSLTEKLATAPRRRDFKTVPMILDRRELWDFEALDLVLGYRGTRKQAWDNTDLAGPWLNVMRNAINAQVWSFGHPDFLVVSATHGSANLALYRPEMWDKYRLASLTDGKYKSNTLIDEAAGSGADATDFENPAGVFSSHNNSVVALQRRGAVFLSCHNAIWELADKLVSQDANPDHLTVDALAAELTNHLIEGVVLIPGATGTLPELQQAGFHYAR